VAQVNGFSAVEMFEHIAPGGFGVAGPNRLEDAGVRTDGIRIIVDGPAHGKAVRHGPVQRDEHAKADPVARHFPDDPVKTLIAGGHVRKRSGFEMAFHVGHRFLQLQELIRGVTFGGAGGEFRFENAPGFVEFAEGDAIDQKEKIEGRAQCGGGVLGEVRSVAHALTDDAHNLERFESLAHRRTINAEAFRQIALGRQLGAVMKVAILDHLFQTSHQRGRQVSIGCRGHLLLSVSQFSKRGGWEM